MPSDTTEPSGPDTGSVESEAAHRARRPARERKQVLLRLDPAVHEALQGWASSELRSVNSQVEILLREALKDAGRLPRDVRPLPRRGRPPAGG